MNTNPKFKKNKHILYDPLIIPRVKQYLEENVHQTYVDVAVMARQLQDRYREYSRRKVGPFRMLVEQAYRTVLHSYGLDSNPSSEENDGDGSDVEMMEGDTTPANHLNNALTDMYSKNTQKNDELIDISSDESGTEADKAPPKSDTNSIKPIEGNDLKLLVSKFSKNGAKPDELEPKQGVLLCGPQASVNPITKKRKIDHNTVQPSGGKTPPRSGGNDRDTPITIQPVVTTQPIGPGPGPGPQRAKKYKKEVKPKNSFVVFHDLGGMDRVLKELCELVFHMNHPQIYNHIGADPPRGILLHGPPGCGKTLLASAIAGQLNVPIIEVPATELIGGVSGESEERIRDVFEQAAANAPCVLFIDEIDAISSNRSNAQRDMERRIVAQLISSLDNLSKVETGNRVLVLGATNRVESVDPALRRVGRFDHEISLGIPDRDEREEILMVICEGLNLESPMDYAKIAELTPGYVGADLAALTARAASIAIKRAFTNIYRKKEEEASKNITIVDLIDDESARDNANKDEAVPEVQDKDAIAAAAVGEAVDNEDITIITDPDVAVDNETVVVDGAVAASEEKTEIAESTVTADTEDDKTNENATAEKPNGEAATVETEEIEDEKKDEGTEKMDVAATATEEDAGKAKDTGEAPADEVMDAIDLDELPDEPVQPEGKSKTREMTLFEMINWIEQDTESILSKKQLSDLCITLDDFKNAVKLTVPSAKREGFITVPDVTWDDIGSLRDIREELQLAVLAPVKFPEKMKVLGLTAPSGVLLCGPPGCGKTLIAKAIANEAGINFISVKGPELMNMYVGESERAVRQCFQRARNSQPCVIFFDEFDSLCPKRSDSTDGGSATRVVNQLLTEMDGVEDRKGVFLMAASNRPDIIDPAVLRPGRLDTILYVGLPKKQDRVEIIEALTKKGTEPALDSDVEIQTIANKTEGYTGADLSGLIRQACLLRLKESISGNTPDDNELKVQNKHFIQALSLIKPSVSLEDQKIYDKLRAKYAAPRLTQNQ